MTDRRLDWNAIRPLNGGRANGFEELCAQLARAESPVGAQFFRKGTPDAGVECYCVLSNNSEWGWQSKYFDSLGDSQWTQLDESVKTALDKHPHLIRYFVCLPLDLPDGRIGKKQSAKMRWDSHVKKWKKWATAKGRNVEYVFWGSHELLERLSMPQHVGRVLFWFDVRGFDKDWFSARLNESLLTAGPRYTPEIHVDLPIAAEFEAFGRTDKFIKDVKTQARGVREKFRILNYLSTGEDPTIEASLTSLRGEIEAILAKFSNIQNHPTETLAFAEIAKQAKNAWSTIDKLIDATTQRETLHHKAFITKEEESPEEESLSSKHSVEALRDRRIRLQHLSVELKKASAVLLHASRLANCRLLVLRGAAGTGKTHLLCDVAHQRIETGRPTVLLMGQRFVSSDAPWTQALQQLDLPGLSAEQFVGALEAAAQSAGCRALLVIDAINEGTGRTLWPSHLGAFLAHLNRSPWIGVVLSIRSSYEELIIPAEVAAHAHQITHEGFSEHEYDATRTFFVHYGLELPSTPLLAPEFRNPLFLKSICRGLKADGKTRLPRGFQGITGVFELYLTAINKQLAITLGFNPRSPLVQKSLEAFSRALIESENRWISLTMAEELVNAMLPGRDFEKSLYRGLVVEGVLVEESFPQGDLGREAVVFVSYERFADHLIAATLLERHLDKDNPASAFSSGAALSFLVDGKKYVAPGLAEALCIQIPERIGKEFATVAPEIVKRGWFGDAFRQSLIWRSLDAFSESTVKELNRVSLNEYSLNSTLDSLLTVATIPDHPLNARFLNERLRMDTLPARDAWWSKYLHQALGTRGPVDRILDWAASVSANQVLGNEILDLCSISLAWMLTTSNRFLRDKATKSLVLLLSGRMDAVGRLVKRFFDVNDPYVIERVYAVSYGVSMRCHDSAMVSALAEQVFSDFFSHKEPLAHILARDYARGIVERAAYLNSSISIDMSRIRPPYKSQWPTMPSEQQIEPLLPDWSVGAHDSGDVAWARNRIGSSVMNDDFAFYVIGTNSSSTSDTWLSLKIDAPAWKPPATTREKLHALFIEFSDEEKAAWSAFTEANVAFERARSKHMSDWFDLREEHSAGADTLSALVTDDSRIDELALEFEKSYPPELVSIRTRKEEALSTLDKTLTANHAEELQELLEHETSTPDKDAAPRLDLSQLQRFILWRVFDLGWTTELFGQFDRFVIGYDGREAHKAERIGKKYQWIAYHEILAFVSDEFQYNEQYRDDGPSAYDGPWQIDGLRDIDPSCTIQHSQKDVPWGVHDNPWWGVVSYANYSSGQHEDWVTRCDDLPAVMDLLIAKKPGDASSWLNLLGDFDWSQQPPADRDSTEVERRDFWMQCTGYLVRKEDANAFIEWAEEVDFWGQWMPTPPETTKMFLGEHGWAPASMHFQQQYFGESDWVQPEKDCPVEIRVTAFNYMKESGGVDCSSDEGYTLHLPSTALMSGMNLRWVGNDAEFVDDKGHLAAFDPTVRTPGPGALLVREDLLRRFLERENLTLCWSVIGEKRVLAPIVAPRHHYSKLRLSGAYMIGEDKVAGFLKCFLRDAAAETSDDQLIEVLRTAP